MKNFKEMKIPGMQTRVVIKPISGRVNTNDPIQLELPFTDLQKK